MPTNMRNAAILLLLATTACAVNDAAPQAQIARPVPQAALTYPATERQQIVETQFGQPIADPYRWLEDDVRESSKVAAWVAQQNALTDSYLATLPERPVFLERMRQLFEFERFGIPQKVG